MTRETKIGLLVGLCFIIVIGILLSDHFRSTMEPPEAPLVNAGQYVRAGVNSPGSGNPPINFIAPQDAPPSQTVPTQGELAPKPTPVIPAPVNNIQANGQAPVTQQVAQQPAAPAVINQVASADAPQSNNQLDEAARSHGEQLVPARIDGTSSNSNNTIASLPSAPGSAMSYKAQPGDTLSRMAAKFLGSSSQANINAIIDANPSLKDDPDTIYVGHAYNIPGRESAAVQNNQPTATAMAPSAPTSGSDVYVVQEGDSLWRIANDQLDDPSAVNTIKSLNSDILKGANHDVVTPGMRLRLPAKPIASAS